MDFVTGLPRSPKGHEAIWLIVDRVKKTSHFISVKMNYSLDQLAQIYIDEIVSLYGVPTSIVSDRDPRFTSKFWESLHKALGTNLSFSIAFHPQTDGIKAMPLLEVWVPHARTRVPVRGVNCSDPKGGLAIHGIPHHLGKHIGMCL